MPCPVTGWHSAWQGCLFCIQEEVGTVLASTVSTVCAWVKEQARAFCHGLWWASFPFSTSLPPLAQSTQGSVKVPGLFAESLANPVSSIIWLLRQREHSSLRLNLADAIR